MKYKVEYAKFMKIDIEAKTLEEAQEKANTMDDDYIELHGENYEPCGYIVWNEPKELNRSDEMGKYMANEALDAAVASIIEKEIG